MNQISFKKSLRFSLVLMLVLAVALVFAACSSDDDSDTDTGTGTTTESGTGATGGAAEVVDGDYTAAAAQGTGLPHDTAGEITVFLWGGGEGDDQLRRDVGRTNIPVSEIGSSSAGGVIASARAFNEIFPNIAINVYVRVGDPNADDVPWIQYRENFALEHGQPDIFGVYNLIDEILMGNVADLTIFQDEPTFRQFNPTLMEMGNIGGQQFALPGYVLPWGVYVNRTLAEAQNIDVPNHNWTIEQYFRFVDHSSPNEFYGSMAPPWVVVDSGTPDFHYLLLNRGSNDPFVRLNSPEMRDLLSMMPRAIPHAVWAQNGAGNVAPEFMDDNWWWAFRFFQNGRVLALESQPYMMGALATSGGDLEAVMANWDIFPRPSTPYVGNHVGLIFDPIGIRNFAMNDGNPELNEEEYQQLRIAFEFLTFMNGDTRAWQARSQQQYTSGDGFGIAMNDSFPKVTGAAFYEQMEFWYQGGRERFRDPATMPGFHYMMQVWERGDIVGFSDKVVPWWHDFEGSRRLIAHEWLNKWSFDVAGASDGEPHWLDMVFARLADWDVDTNARFVEAWADVFAAIDRFYPIQTRPGS